MLMRPLGRRELAAREHIVAHEPGKGQQAFAPNRRDMAAYRAEVEKRRLDEAREAAASAPAPPPAAAPSPDPAAPAAAQPASTADAQPPANPLAALRISQPLQGMRVVQPRGPPVLRPQPVARPAPRKPAAEADSAPARPAPDVPQPPPETDASLFPAAATATATAPSPASAVAPPPPSAPRVDPPLLPSHTCSSYFVEPLSWMSPVLETGVLAGKIVCPNAKCGAKLGSFDWAGSRASCFPFFLSAWWVWKHEGLTRQSHARRVLVRRVGVPRFRTQRLSR